jgi:hypothetical protein
MLCDLCQRISFSPRALLDQPGQEGTAIAVIHQTGPKALKETAESGCHLCTLIWYGLAAKNEESTLPEREIILHVCHDTSVDFFTEDQRDEYRMDAYCGDLKVELELTNLPGKPLQETKENILRFSCRSQDLSC